VFEPTAEEFSQLRVYAYTHGRSWKKILQEQWKAHKLATPPWPVLAQMMQRLGGEFPDRFTLPPATEPLLWKLGMDYEAAVMVRQDLYAIPSDQRGPGFNASARAAGERETDAGRLFWSHLPPHQWTRIGTTLYMREPGRTFRIQDTFVRDLNPAAPAGAKKG
jgi:hypothetical protein